MIRSLREQTAEGRGGGRQHGFGSSLLVSRYRLPLWPATHKVEVGLIEDSFYLCTFLNHVGYSQVVLYYEFNLLDMHSVNQVLKC